MAVSHGIEIDLSDNANKILLWLGVEQVVDAKVDTQSVRYGPFNVGVVKDLAWHLCRALIDVDGVR